MLQARTSSNKYDAVRLAIPLRHVGNVVLLPSIVELAFIYMPMVLYMRNDRKEFKPNIDECSLRSVFTKRNQTLFVMKETLSSLCTTYIALFHQAKHIFFFFSFCNRRAREWELSCFNSFFGVLICTAVPTDRLLSCEFVSKTDGEKCHVIFFPRMKQSTWGTHSYNKHNNDLIKTNNHTTEIKTHVVAYGLCGYLVFTHFS